jgi:hypothetical protein
MTYDPLIQERKEELIKLAQKMIDDIVCLAPDSVPDPLTDAPTLTKAVTQGILDAPQLINNPFAKGTIRTHIDKRGACVILPK